MGVLRARVKETIGLGTTILGGGWSDRFMKTSPTGDRMAWHTAVAASALHRLIDDSTFGVAR